MLIIDRMHHPKVMNRIALSDTATIETQPPSAMPNAATISRVVKDSDCCTVRPKQPRRFIVQETDKTWYNGILGSVRTHKKSTRSIYSSTTRQNQTEVVKEESSIIINSSFLRRGLELLFLNSFGQISRSLNIYPVLMANDPIFQLCKKGDIDGMQVAFSGGCLSPFVLDQYGSTLLHVRGYATIPMGYWADHP